MSTKGTLKILDPTGHTELAWDKLSDATRSEAEKAFAIALENRHTPYLMAANDEGKVVGTAINDGKLPETGDIVMAPLLVGG